MAGAGASDPAAANWSTDSARKFAWPELAAGLRARAAGCRELRRDPRGALAARAEARRLQLLAPRLRLLEGAGADAAIRLVLERQLVGALLLVEQGTPRALRLARQLGLLIEEGLVDGSG